MAFNPNIAIVVLAAGGSKRMGTAKQALPWGNSTLIEHVIQMAIKTPANEVLVVLGANSELVSTSIKQYAISILQNENWELGLGTSISKAINHILYSKPELNGVLFILADQPFITSDYLKTMIQNFESNNNRIIASSYSEGDYGVPVLFSSIYFSELSELKGDHGAKDVLRKYKSQIVVLAPPNINVDLDTQADYKKFNKRKTDK